ncbi:hypothetical protein P7C70_g1272, partial [Phenoliferia sp. Uapishka_3]
MVMDERRSTREEFISTLLTSSYSEDLGIFGVYGNANAQREEDVWRCREARPWAGTGTLTFRFNLRLNFNSEAYWPLQVASRHGAPESPFITYPAELTSCGFGPTSSSTTSLVVYPMKSSTWREHKWVGGWLSQSDFGSDDLFTTFLEDGVFGEVDDASGVGPLSHQQLDAASTHAKPHSAFRTELNGPSQVSTPSSGGLESPEVFSPFNDTAESSLTSASTSPPFTNGNGAIMYSGAANGIEASDPQSQSAFDWRTGTPAGQYMGGGSGLPAASSTDFMHSPYLAMHSPLPLGSNPYFAGLSSSFPSQPAPEWNHANFAHSYSHSSNLFQPQTFLAQSLSHPNTPIPTASNAFYPLNGSPQSSYSVPDQSLLSLQMSLETQAQGRPGGAVSSNGSAPGSSVAAAVDRMQRASAANNLERPGTKRTPSSTSVHRGSNGRSTGAAAAHLRGATYPSHSTQPFPSPPISGASHHLYAQHFAEQASPYPPAGSPATYQRPLPPLPRRTGALSSTVPAGSSTSTSITATSPYPQPHSRGSSVVAPTPPASRPASPRLAALDYDFSSMEKDLDRFSSGGFASAAAAAMASVGPTRRAHQNNSPYGYSSPGSPYLEGASPRVVHDVLSENVYASLPPRSPAVSNGASPAGGAAPTPSDSGGYSFFNGLDGYVQEPSPGGDPGSPTGSTIIDEEAAEALSKKDPIAAQVWRMFNKAKNTLPNGARMENLTWRLMSMTLKKRKEETAAAAEAEALAATLIAEELAREELDDVVELASKANHDSSRKASVKGKEKAEDQSSTAEGEDDESRGRRGRTHTPKSSSGSPEAPVEEDDFMDWRAKSQSRSRSRAPDMAMDWRAPSRSRSRLRAPVAPPTLSAPTITTVPVTASLSRFFGDSGSVADTRDTRLDNVQEDLAASLGLSTTTGLFGSASDFNSQSLDFTQTRNTPSVQSPSSYGASPGKFNAVSPPAFNFPEASSPAGTTANTDANLAAIESTLNQLISLQSIAATSPHPPSPWLHSSSPITRSPAKTNGSLPSFPPRSFSELLLKGEEGGAYPFGQADRGSYKGESSTSQPSTPSQLQLQHLANQVRKAGQASQLASSSGTSRASASPYINATTLAQSSRPFSFAQSAASGLSLARPGVVPPEAFHVQSPEVYSAPPTPSHVYPSSAPANNHFLNPTSPYYDNSDSHSSYDYFQSPDNYPSPFQNNLHDNAPTHVDPSQLLNNQGSGSHGLFESDSWGGFSPAAAFSPPSDSARSTPSPKDGTNPVPSQQRRVHHGHRSVSLAGHTIHSASSPDLVSLMGNAALSSKSAPGSRTHSRSNTISLPPSIYEGTPLASGPIKDSSVPPPIGAGGSDDSAIKCLNCSTTNTPLWRRDADGRPLCNACGLFRNLHGVDRPANLNTGVIKKRNRARGPKDQVPKKGSTGRAARRNSLGGPPPVARAAAARSNAVPYPTQAARAGQSTS